MAKSHQSSVQDQMADVTECSICTEIYTNPKILPCIHTFCLQCLENYGRDKKTGDPMACPICRSEFLIPDGGLCSLPHNFFIDKMVEIRRLSETPTNEALCGICPDEDRVKAKMFCFECEHNLCDRCVIAHKKIKLCQNHQVVEIGTKLKPHEVTFRNSYCDQHPGELVKMYCEDDKATICFLCFAESHQSHKCLNVIKASEEFSYSIKNDFKTVTRRIPEFQTSLQKFDKLEKDLLAQIVDAEKKIFDEAGRLKTLIDSHANILIKKLTALKDKKLKEIESMKEDIEMFKVTLESYAKYSEELLSKGAPGDICREADQLKTRARELASLTTDFCARNFNCDGIIFKSLNLEDVLRVNSIANVVGDVRAESVKDGLVPIFTRDAVEVELDEETKRLPEDLANLKLSSKKEQTKVDLKVNRERISETLTNLEPHQSALIRTKEFKKNLRQKLPDLKFDIKQIELKLCGTLDVVKRAKLYILERVAAAVQDSFEISESKSKVFAKDGTKPYLMKQLLNNGISASWMCNGRSVVVFALDYENLRKAINVLKNEVIESRLPLSAARLLQYFDQTHQWKDFMTCLCRENKLLEIDLKDSVIIVANIRRLIERNKRRIEDFIIRSGLHPKDMCFGLAIQDSWR